MTGYHLISYDGIIHKGPDHVKAFDGYHLTRDGFTAFSTCIADNVKAAILQGNNVFHVYKFAIYKVYLCEPKVPKTTLFVFHLTNFDQK